MTNKDFKVRLDFAKKCLKKVGDDLWLKKISFYYDGVSFVHKTNPFSEAISPKSKIWRTKKEGLTMTGKGKKVGNNGKAVRVFVAISYDKGVIMAEQLPDKVRFVGCNYREFVEKHFPLALSNSTKPRNKLIQQDGDPIQKSKRAYLG